MDKKETAVKVNRKLIAREIFYFLTALAGVFIVFELIWPNIILAYFNLNYLIISGVVVGLISLLAGRQSE